MYVVSITFLSLLLHPIGFIKLQQVQCSVFVPNFASVTHHSRYTSKLTGDRRQQRILTYPAALFAKLHTQTDGEVDGHVAPATRLHHSHYHRPLTLLMSLEIYLPHLTARPSHPFWKHNKTVWQFYTKAEWDTCCFLCQPICWHMPNEFPHSAERRW